MSLRRSYRVLAVLGAVALTAGCGGLADEDVTRAAEEFAAGDEAVRCALLAPSTLGALVEEESSSCEEAISELPLGSGEVVSVAVWGEEAQVKLNDDTLFLTHASGGWRIVAGACRSQGSDLPYECRLEA